MIAGFRLFAAARPSACTVARCAAASSVGARSAASLVRGVADDAASRAGSRAASAAEGTADAAPSSSAPAGSAAAAAASAAADADAAAAANYEALRRAMAEQMTCVRRAAAASYLLRSNHRYADGGASAVCFERRRCSVVVRMGREGAALVSEC
jgi:hypothetical protein